jgi:hypothetical protein
MSENIVLTNVEGITRKSGTDQHNCQWTEFAVDSFAEQEPGECQVCGKTIHSGWTCLDGGDEVCDAHVLAIDPEPFIAAYIRTALWTSSDEHGPFDAFFAPCDIDPETMAKFREDCLDFVCCHAVDIKDDMARAGQDFWLTRNRHGAGFWDGDWEHTVGRRLTDAAHVYGSVYLYVGDDGRIHS